jgi:DNA polymerase III subunit gamma/tau
VPYQSLYRRYRPRRFDELKGQDHVSRTVRNAVAQERVAHAYLFSGPRGTGKTSTARILAKALNCAAPVDGEPCGVCPSCVEIEAGSSLDVHELDAASNNGVDAMRDLVARAALGTPGRWKVYIVDEVHMLSAAASNALLKTLEEPPAHVVFVLATTDPQKVLPTVRSRTQHFEFRLLPADVLVDHLRWVAAEAGLEVAPEAIELVARRGNGSVRDALSALDQVAAAGGVEEDAAPVDAVVEALCERDVGPVLVAVAERCGAGHDPRQLARDLLEHLRQAFLASLAPNLLGLPDDELARLGDQARRLGAPTVVRAMELLGEALVDMRESPDPRVNLETALVRLCRADADTSPAALLERIERLERTLGERAAAPAVAAAREAVAKPPKDSPPPPRAAGPRPALGGVRAAEASRPPAPPQDDVPFPSRDQMTLAWGDRVLGQLPGRARALYKSGRFLAVEDGVAVYALPNAVHRERCERIRDDVEQALAGEFGRHVPLRLVVEPDVAVPPPSNPADEPAVDLTDLQDAPAAGLTSPIDHVMQAFEGAEVVEE